MSDPATTPALADFLATAARGRSGDDPIFALNAEARKRRAAGEDVINATLGALLDDEGKLMTLPSVAAAIAAIDPVRSAAYAPIQGEPRFLEGVRRDLFGDGGLFESSLAVATPGGSGALVLAIQTVLEPGQDVLVPDLYWGPYRTMAEQAGRGIATFPTFDGSGGLDLFSLEREVHRLAKAQGRVLLILNFPCNNPTGYSPSSAEWRTLAALLKSAAKHGRITVLVDHAYARFARADDAAWREALASALPEILLLVAWTASKSFAQYGARVGALVAAHPDAKLRVTLNDAFGFGCRGLWSNCNHLGQLAIGGLLETAAATIANERAALVSVLEARVAAFNQHAKAARLRHPRYEGGFFVTVFTRDGHALAARARDRGVFVVPQKGGVRVALCSTPAKRVEELVAALAE
jgi:aromatic-amino-acid transaminase